MNKTTKMEKISLPKALIDEIRNFLDVHPELGYTKAPEFIREACRFLLIERKEHYTVKEFIKLQKEKEELLKELNS